MSQNETSDWLNFFLRLFSGEKKLEPAVETFRQEKGSQSLWKVCLFVHRVDMCMYMYDCCHRHVWWCYRHLCTCCGRYGLPAACWWARQASLIFWREQNWLVTARGSGGSWHHASFRSAPQATNAAVIVHFSPHSFRFFRSSVFITTFIGFEPTTFWIFNVGYFSEANQYVGKIFQIVCDHDFHRPLHLHASFSY